MIIFKEQISLNWDFTQLGQLGMNLGGRRDRKQTKRVINGQIVGASKQTEMQQMQLLLLQQNETIKRLEKQIAA